MKSLTILCAVGVAFLLCLNGREVSAQMFSPTLYGGGPLSYGYGGDNDDDIGILLAILLLAARNKGSSCGAGNCCYNCCNCNNAKTVPVPIPIPFPTNNAIIRQYDSYDNEDIPSQVINVETESNDETEIDVKVENDPSFTSNVASSSSASKAKSTTNNANNS